MIRVSLERLIFFIKRAFVNDLSQMLGFYVTFDELKEKLVEEAPNKYANAFDFLTKLKFIMAKLTVRTYICSSQKFPLIMNYAI